MTNVNSAQKSLLFVLLSWFPILYTLDGELPIGREYARVKEIQNAF